jgi:hypothetical protein
MSKDGGFVGHIDTLDNLVFIGSVAPHQQHGGGCVLVRRERAMMGAGLRVVVHISHDGSGVCAGVCRHASVCVSRCGCVRVCVSRRGCVRVCRIVGCMKVDRCRCMGVWSVQGVWVCGSMEFGVQCAGCAGGCEVWGSRL